MVLLSSRLAGFALLSFAALTGCNSSVATGTGGAGGSNSTSSGFEDTTGTTATAGTTGASSSTSASSSSGSASCAGTSSTMLPGVHIDIDASQCTFSLSDPMAKITIPYQVVIDEDVAGVSPRPQDAGGCGAPGPSGLIVFEKVDGNGQKYCLCDVGLCAMQGDMPVTLKAGSYPATFTWDEHNWFGPSDTGMPEGPTFPPGDYTLTVRAIGVQPSPMGDMG